jgi:DNA repair ATPase RecN
MRNQITKLYSDENDALKYIKEHKNEFVGLNKLECSKKLGVKGQINKGCILWRAFERLPEVNLQFIKDKTKYYTLEEISENNIQLTEKEIVNQEIVNQEIVNEEIDIITQTEQNLQKMGEALVDMLDIFANTLNEIKQLKEEKNNIVNILKQKNENISYIELRLRKSNDITQQWFDKYEEMKEKYLNK